MAARLAEIAIDCTDPAALARFWCAALGHTVLDAEPDLVTIGGPDGTDGPSPVLTFARVPEPKTVKNRLHLDLRPTDRDRAAEVDRLVGLGARPVDVGQGASRWTVLADPEGNEFCVLEP